MTAAAPSAALVPGGASVNEARVAGVGGVPAGHCGLTDTACELDLRQFTAGVVSTPLVIRARCGYIGAVVVSP